MYILLLLLIIKTCYLLVKQHVMSVLLLENKQEMSFYLMSVSKFAKLSGPYWILQFKLWSLEHAMWNHNAYSKHWITHPINRFNPATFWCLSQDRIWISNAICRGLFVFNCLRWKVVIHFVNIDGIVDHHRLNFVFITRNNE